MKRNNLFKFLLLLLALILGLLCQPSVLFTNGLPFLAWAAYIPLFLLIDRISLPFSFIYGFIYGFIFYFCLCWWFSSFGIIALVFVAFLYAFYYGALFFLIKCLRKLLPEKYSSAYCWLRVMFLLAFDFFRTRGIFAFSYGILGYSQWRNSAFLHFASFFGVHGVSFLLYSFNSCMAKVISEKNIRSNLMMLSLCLSLISAIFISNSFSLYKREEGENGRNLSFALIQNASSAPSANISDYQNDVALLKKLSDEALTIAPDTELVVWPETAVVPDILYHHSHDNDKKRHELSESVLTYVASKNASFIIGNNFSDGAGNHNAALFFSPESEVKVSMKNHLVPFTEYWPPFLDYAFFDGIKNRLNYDFFLPGDKIELFDFNGISISVPICFEDSFPSLIKKMKNLGAELFVVISDDAWAKSSAAQNIHCAMGCFRSAEFAVPSLRGTIDGKTCVIDRHGMIVSELETGVDGFLLGKIEVGDGSKTLFSLIGELPLCIISFSCLSLLLILLLQFAKVKLYDRR